MGFPKDSLWTCVRALGEGSQAHVFEVKRAEGEDQPSYALKCLRSSAPQKARERLRREVQVLQTLSHPNIVKVLDADVDGDPPYYVMELAVATLSLAQRIERNVNPFRGNAALAVGLFEQLASALAACEEKRILHRDLSPGNVLVDSDGRARVIDFGLAFPLDSDASLTEVDEGVGTRNYAAPECEVGSGGEVTIASDLYSAAKIMWTAITGERCFARERPVFDQLSMTTKFPDKPETWHLTGIFEKTIRHEPHNRWQSAREAAGFARRVRQAIEVGVPPLERIHESCPDCRVGRRSGVSDEVPFGAIVQRSSGIVHMRCDHCFTYSAVQQKALRERLTFREGLEKP